MRTIGAAAVLVVLAATSGCASRTSSTARQVDPAVRAAVAVLALERTRLPVTKEQATQMLPLFRALRGTEATDQPAVGALVRQIDRILTDAQHGELRRLRSQRPPDARDAPGGVPGSGGGFGPGGGGTPGTGPGALPGGRAVRPGQPGALPQSADRSAAFRGQILDRAIVLLEARVQ